MLQTYLFLLSIVTFIKLKNTCICLIWTLVKYCLWIKGIHRSFQLKRKTCQVIISRKKRFSNGSPRNTSAKTFCTKTPQKEEKLGFYIYWKHIFNKLFFIVLNHTVCMFFPLQTILCALDREGRNKEILKKSQNKATYKWTQIHSAEIINTCCTSKLLEKTPEWLH